MKCSPVIAFVVTLLTAGTLHAQGVVMVQEETRDGKTSTNQIQMDASHMRMESHASGRHSAFVFDAPAKVARILNLEQQTYVEIDQAQMQQMRQQMTAMQEKLKNLPPQQREMFEQMMRGRGGMGAPPPPPEYKQTGADKVGAWPCTKYEAYTAGRKTAEICAADPGVFGLSASDFAVATQLGEFVRSMVPEMGDQTVMFGAASEQGFSGVPVRRTTFVDGKVTATSEIKEFRRAPVPASAWEVPAGFKRQEMGGRR